MEIIGIIALVIGFGSMAIAALFITAMLVDVKWLQNIFDWIAGRYLRLTNR
jgi:hypothetical protein